LKTMILEHEAYICNETLAEAIDFQLKEESFQAEFKIGKSKFTVGVERY